MQNPSNLLFWWIACQEELDDGLTDLTELKVSTITNVSEVLALDSAQCR